MNFEVLLEDKVWVKYKRVLKDYKSKEVWRRQRRVDGEEQRVDREREGVPRRS